jgi:hypothetical protein
MVSTEMKVFKTIVDTAEPLFIKATRDIMDITVIRTIMIVPDPSKGVCADPVNGGAILGKGDRIPKAGTMSVS